MGKRGNENAQLTKEEFEALESRGDSTESGTFARASEEVLARRKIIRRARKPSSAPPSVSNFGGNSSSQSTSSGGGIFSNVQLGGSSSNAPTSTSSSMPRFAMPSSSGASAAPPKNAFASVNLVPSAPKADAFAGRSSKKTDDISKKREALTDMCKKYVSDAPLRQDYTLATMRFLATAKALDDEESELQSKENESSMSNAAAAAAAPSMAKQSPSSTPAPSLFAPAPAPDFTFGSESSTPAPAPASKPSFSFAPATATSTSESPAPAVSSGFSFAPAPTSAAPIPGANVKISLSPVPESSTNAGEETDEAAPEEEKTELESADGDWNIVKTVKVRLYHFRDESTGKPKKFASGNLKLQQHKTEVKSRRMVLRESSSGAVLFNVGIFENMTFQKHISDKEASGKKPTATITFVGVMSTERGAERFTIACSTEDVEDFYKKLKEFTS